MQSSYTPEQEAQLTEWGCPRQFGAVTVSGEGPIPALPTLQRQPHDVLAWLNARDVSGVGSQEIPLLAPVYDGLGDIWWAAGWAYRWYDGELSHATGVSTCRPVLADLHPDPYTATFALAQAVMEAK